MVNSAMRRIAPPVSWTAEDHDGIPLGVVEHTGTAGDVILLQPGIFMAGRSQVAPSIDCRVSSAREQRSPVHHVERRQSPVAERIHDEESLAVRSDGVLIGQK
jgi:hypothetical protein